MTVYAYLRVSTDDQDHGVDAQRAAISKVVQVDEWFEERASGKSLDGRPVLVNLLDRVCDEKATLVVGKLDRLGRSVVDVLNVFERLQECGASIKVLDMGIDTSTPAGEMMLTVLAAFAQFERRMISQRTKDGLAAAKAKGVKLGRPVGSRVLSLEQLSWSTLQTYRSRAKSKDDKVALTLIEMEMERRLADER